MWIEDLDGAMMVGGCLRDADVLRGERARVEEVSCAEVGGVVLGPILCFPGVVGTCKLLQCGFFFVMSWYWYRARLGSGSLSLPVRMSGGGAGLHCYGGEQYQTYTK